MSTARWKEIQEEPTIIIFLAFCRITQNVLASFLSDIQPLLDKSFNSAFGHSGQFSPFVFFVPEVTKFITPGCGGCSRRKQISIISAEASRRPHLLDASMNNTARVKLELGSPARSLNSLYSSDSLVISFLAVH